jgi:hypothetical protein
VISSPEQLLPSPTAIVRDVVKRYAAGNASGERPPVLFVNSMFRTALVMELMAEHGEIFDPEDESVNVSTIFYNDITVVVADGLFPENGFYCSAFTSYANKSIKPAT